MGEVEVLLVLKKNGGWMTTLEVFREKCGCNRTNTARVLRALSDRGEVFEKQRKQCFGNQFKFKEPIEMTVSTIGSKQENI